MNEKKQPSDGTKQGIIFDQIGRMFDGLSFIRELQYDNKELVKRLFGGNFPSELDEKCAKTSLDEIEINSVTCQLDKINERIDAIIEREKEIKGCLINYIG